MTNRLYSYLLLCFICLNLQSLEVKAQKSKAVSDDSHPKNIILLIGDGMGLATINAAILTAPYDLNIQQCTNTAIVKTSSADDEVTDSAAAGTAIATGTKTNNGAIGVDADSIPLKSILKIAEENSLSTGMVVTCDVTHATPASFIANVASRNQSNQIAAQFLKTDIDVFIGGGLNTFSQRADSINYVDSLVAHGYNIATNISDLNKYTTGKLAGLLYPLHPPKVSEGRGNMLSIATQKALDILSQNDKGFFLMIEGSQIDWGAHENDANYMLSELVDFDQAITIALDFAATHPETLVIITADHETGGLTLIESATEKGKMQLNFSTKQHTATPVPLFAYGKGAERFKGFIDNTDIFKLMMSSFGFKN